MKRLIAILLLVCCISSPARTSREGKTVGGIARFEKTVHDFGTIGIKDGPQECSFRVDNVGEVDMVIFAVISSCGCTSVEWTRETVHAGGSGYIKASYSNDEGPYPFDKTLTVYIKDVEKPVVLHLKGTVRK